jgi:hypothetical protein
MKSIPGYEGIYACDEQGVIYSLARTIKRTRKNGKTFEWKLPLITMSPYVQKHGYLQCNFRKNGKNYSLLVHRLIGITYLGLKDNQEINHKDGNKQNNKLENLEITTRSENIKHAFRIGLRSHKGSNHPNYFINDTIKKEVRLLLDKNISQTKIGELVGISQKNVSKIKLGKI